jgi:hypothetical protein
MIDEGKLWRLVRAAMRRYAMQDQVRNAREAVERVEIMDAVELDGQRLSAVFGTARKRAHQWRHRK